ncbi:YjbF family lipoprotein [Billgrantia lactosivorans]|uniref:YjbF family lipoprotein n=1 Tax=Billgrantia lactosivorans TaxID=2185141 RepID=UPI000DADBBB1|nr:YjbF family lipoprotein [Halomonas lactosivorans]
MDQQALFQGRLRAVLLFLLLASQAGCASDGLTPLGASLQALLPNSESLGDQARDIPYASLAIKAGDVRGLMVMGAQQGGFSYWPSREGLLLTFQDDALMTFTGLEQELLSTRYDSATLPWQQASPAPFRITLRWRGTQGQLHSDVAGGQLHCGEPSQRSLPMGNRLLQPCEQRLTWTDGSQTEATLWRDPQTFALWEWNGQLWPGAPRVHWQVARQWW